VTVSFAVPTGHPEAASRYRRTPAEKADAVLAWARPDRAVFAAGACHVLAYRFVERMPEAGFGLVHLRPKDVEVAYHVFSTNGTIAFDFNGFSDDAALRTVNSNAMLADDPAWRAQFDVIDDDLETFCRLNGCRPPSLYPGDIVARADRYIERLLADDR